MEEDQYSKLNTQDLVRELQNFRAIKRKMFYRGAHLTRRESVLKTTITLAIEWISLTIFEMEELTESDEWCEFEEEEYELGEEKEECEFGEEEGERELDYE